MVLGLEGGASAYGIGDMQCGPLSTDKEDIFLFFWNHSLNIILSWLSTLQSEGVAHSFFKKILFSFIEISHISQNFSYFILFLK